MSVRILRGDCRDVLLPTLPANSVHCVVSSPPYFGLRDYGVAGQLGLEPTPDEYIATMVEVFREVRRVLRDDGTLWLNMGDSYAGSATAGSFRPGAGRANGIVDERGQRNRNGNACPDGMKPKDLLMMPARLALALQADGWWLRSDIIWSKPNPMPESVTDRPTSAHEHVFLLTKSARYFYDADAIRGSSLDEHKPKLNAAGEIAGANARNVWTIAAEAFSAAHFATFPTELAERCIRAGTSERGCCAACGKPWVRVTERGAAVPLTPSDAGRKATWTIGDGKRDPALRTDTPLPRHYRPVLSESWTASCQCNADVTPCTVLDPFAGAGTTGLVADRLQRNAVLIELSADYVRMARERIEGDAPLFASVA